MKECVGPRCSSQGIRRSVSGMIEATSTNGMFKLMFRDLDVAFPSIYPKAKCPTANIDCSSLWLQWHMI